MRRPLILALTLAAACAAYAGAAAAPQRWVRVGTAAGFSVERPADWMTLAGPTVALHIASGPCRAEAAALCPGQSRIVVTSEPVAMARPSRLKSCWSLQESKTQEPPPPGSAESVELGDHLTCTIRDRRFTIRESHWKGDRNAASYGRIAIRMAKSLRYPG